MKYLIACMLLSCVAAPAAAQNAPASKEQPPKAEPDEQDAESKETKKNASDKPKEAGKSDDFDMAAIMKMFDKIFPPQPEPPAELLAPARVTAAGVLPDGTYAAMVEELTSGLVDRILSLSPADFSEKKDGAEASKAALRDELAKNDPHFEERMRITRRVIGEELVKVSAILEPRIREGLARSIARRFNAAQLREINAFLATDAGQAFGSQSMRMWMDPDVMRSMFQAFPEMMTAVPGAMKRLEAATAHLPKPKKAEKEKESEAEEEHGEHEQHEEHQH